MFILEIKRQVKKMKQFLEAGKIINKRGLKGELKIESYCDSPQAFCSFDRIYLDSTGKDERKVLSAKVYKDFVYLLIEGVTSAENADKIRGKLVYINRDDMLLDDDTVFIDDIIGLPVYDADNGAHYGELKEVFNTGASDIYRIVKSGKEYLIPAVDEIVISIDLEKGIFIRPIPGLIDDAEEIR